MIWFHIILLCIDYTTNVRPLLPISRCIYSFQGYICLNLSADVMSTLDSASNYNSQTIVWPTNMVTEYYTTHLPQTCSCSWSPDCIHWLHTPGLNHTQCLRTLTPRTHCEVCALWFCISLHEAIVYWLAFWDSCLALVCLL